MGFKSGELLGQIPFAQKPGRCSDSHFCVLVAVCAGAPSYMKMASDIFGHNFLCVSGALIFLHLKTGRQDFSRISFM